MAGREWGRGHDIPPFFPQDLERQSITGDEEVPVVDPNPSNDGGVALIHLTSANDDHPDGGVALVRLNSDHPDGGGAKGTVGASQTAGPPAAEASSSSLKPAQKSSLKSSSCSYTASSPLLSATGPAPASGQFIEQQSPPRRAQQECCALM